MTTYYELATPPINCFEMKYYFNTSSNPTMPKIFSPHIHNELEIYILLEGDAAFMVEQNLYALTPGSAVISKPNEIHNCILNSTSVHKHLCFWIRTDCKFLLEPFLSANFGEGNLIVTDTDKDELFEICGEFSRISGKCTKLELFALTVRLLNLLSRNLHSELSSAQTESLFPAVFKKILNDIDENFAEIVKLSYFTEKYFISISTLNRFFTQYLHTSPKRYLETKKLAYSRILLKTGKNVLEAALESGFENESNYIRLFKRRFGVTPGQYKKTT